MSELERRALLGAAGLGAIAAMAKAGPLNPPAGAVASSGRTTDEIYNKIPAGGSGDGRTAIPGGAGPINITTPGSYVLTGNVAGNGGNGIVIFADHVTLDLNGYTVGSGFSTGNGILVSSGLKGIVIRNGLVSGFSNGVLLSSAPSDVLIENLLIKDAKISGIQGNNITSRGVRLSRCTICDTGSSTTAADPGLIIAGIQLLNSGAVVEECVVSRLLYNGVGLPTFRGVYITGGGMQVVQRCTVIGETAALAGTGISMPATAVRRDNTVVGFTAGYAGGIDGGGNV